MTEVDKSQVRALIVEVWQRTRIDWSFASDHLAALFKRNRHLASTERRFIAEALYGMIRHARRIDEALAAGGLKASVAAPDRERLAAYLVLSGHLTADDAAQEIPDLDWAAVAAIDETLRDVRPPAARIARQYSLPDWLAEHLVADWGDAAAALAAALNERAPMTIRANLVAADSVAEVASALAAEGIETTPGAYCPTALVVDTRTNLFGLDAFRKGLFEAQDEGSQLIAELVAPPPKPRVVDFCAGAGGKSLAIAAATNNRGRVVACDIDGRKLSELRRRARRAGVGNIQAVTLDRDGAFPKPLERLEGKVHRVLVDAPCSGIGALRRNPEARWRLKPADIERLPEQQLDICSRAVSLLAPGGRLIYATCTVIDVENRNVVERLLSRHPTLELVPVKEIWGAERAKGVCDESGTYLEVLPHVHGTDGFFAAVVRRKR